MKRRTTTTTTVTPEQLATLRWAISGLEVQIRRDGKVGDYLDSFGVTREAIEELALLLAHVENNPDHRLKVVEPAACWRLEEDPPAVAS